MKTIYVFLTVFFFGCGYSQSRTRLVSSPSGMQVNESSNCVGMGCGSYGYANGYGQWAMGPAPYQGLAPSWGRLGMIEVYRAQNRWVMGPGSNGNGSSGARDLSAGRQDPRLDRLVPHLRRMANAMCQSGTLTGDDCVSSRSTQNGTAQVSPASAATSNSASAQPAATSAPAVSAVPQEAGAPTVAVPPVSENAHEGAPGHQRRRPITVEEFE